MSDLRDAINEYISRNMAVLGRHWMPLAEHILKVWQAVKSVEGG